MDLMLPNNCQSLKYKIWVDKGREFIIDQWNHARLSCRNVFNTLWRKSVVAKRFVRTLKNEISKYMTSISKNAYINKLVDIVSQYNHTYNRNIKMKFAGVTSSKYIDFRMENNVKVPKFKVGDHVRTSKLENILAKVYVPNWSKKSKNTVLWT